MLTRDEHEKLRVLLTEARITEMTYGHSRASGNWLHSRQQELREEANRAHQAVIDYVDSLREQ